MDKKQIAFLAAFGVLAGGSHASAEVTVEGDYTGQETTTPSQPSPRAGLKTCYDKYSRPDVFYIDPASACPETRDSYGPKPGQISPRTGLRNPPAAPLPAPAAAQ